MDLTQSIEPKSDQLDAVDLLTGPRTFTIESVTAGSSDQPVNIALKDFARPWRPSKSMRRVLVAAWGADGHQYAGRRLTLYCDTSVEFDGIKVGGTRVSHMSHIDKPLAVSLLIKRGKSAVFTVQPLTEPATSTTSDQAETSHVTIADINAAQTPDDLMALWEKSDKGDKVRAQIKARKDQLDGGVA